MPRILKRLRVAVSLLFLVSTTLVFLDFPGLISPVVVRAILFLQFAPSTLNFIRLAGIGAFGFILILGLTILFGRVYCSSVCPLGTLQDLISYASTRARPKKYHEPLQTHRKIHFAFLIVAALPALFGSIFALTLLDPYSNFGRLAQTVFRPIMLFGNNAIAGVLSNFDRFDLYPVALPPFSVVSLALPILFLILIGWMSFRYGRLYCNSMCPVGALLRLFARYSLFKISIAPERCKSCQLCQRVCKAGCIDRKAKSIDSERCVECFNCLTACPSDGIKFTSSYRRRTHNEKTFDETRRSFLLGTPLIWLGKVTASDTTKTIKPKKESTVPERKHYPVAPPGSISLRHFTQTCTACQVCISACPSQVLQPSVLQYGLGGLLQPTMDFSTSYCTFECTRCTEVCPSGALARLSLDEKKLSQSGRVVFIRENCVVYTEDTDCGACTEHCPTKAVTMIPYKNSRMPEVNPDYCVGCGACEHACPTRPYRAIYVDGYPVHHKAKVKPPEKRPEMKTSEDFPF